jgi:hypothetical protein
LDVRVIPGALLAFPLVLCACAATPKPAVRAAPAESPAEAPAASQDSSPYLKEGRYRVSGAANAGFSNTDVGDLETTSLGLAGTAGKMVSDNVLVEGRLEYLSSTIDAGNGDIDETDLFLGVGARYYWLLEGNTYPYARGELGLALVNVDAGNVEDDDNSPYFGLGVGAETFLTRAIALDYGLRFLYAFDLFDESLTDISLFFGLSVWF